MAHKFAKFGFAIVLVVGMAVQLLPARNIFSLVWLGLGIGKNIQPVTDFPYKCRRLEHPRLQACEDMWLSHNTRQLFLACSDPLGRKEWFPTVKHFNLSGRSVKDAVVALDIDSPVGDSFSFRGLQTSGFTGTAGDGLMHVVGMTGTDLSDGRIELLVINYRPSVDNFGAFLDQASVGANATVEVFETEMAAASMKHIRTVVDPLIATPNRVAAVSEGFYLTNDHGAYKTGLMAKLGPLFGTGDVTFCPVAGSCKQVSSGHVYPNGLIYSHVDGQIYVPSAGVGGVKIYKPQPGNELEYVSALDIFHAIDNLSEDSVGGIYAAVHSRGIEILKQVEDPLGIHPASAVIRIQRTEGGGFEWEKILEDRDGMVLPGTTTVVHDAKTGRLFLSGVMSPFITVCNPV